MEVDKNVQEYRGTLKWFSASKGYGFVVRDDGADVLVRREALKDTQLPRPGDRLVFNVSQGDKGLKAVDVRIETRAVNERLPSYGQCIKTLRRYIEQIERHLSKHYRIRRGTLESELAILKRMRPDELAAETEKEILRVASAHRALLNEDSHIPQDFADLVRICEKLLSQFKKCQRCDGRGLVPGLLWGDNTCSRCNGSGTSDW